MGRRNAHQLELHREQQRRYYERHKAEIARREREKRLEDLDGSRARSRAYNQKHYAERGERVRARNQRWAAENPEKRAAHKAVEIALRSGDLARGVCEVCGDTTVHAHHADYSRPLDVRWLCPAHHRGEHLKDA